MHARIRDTTIYFDVDGMGLVPDGPRMRERPTAFVIHGGPGSDHSGFKPTAVGFSKNVPEYPFPIWDPDTIIVQDVRNVTAPPNWPRPGEGHNDPSATYNWIKTTWPTRSA